MHGGSSHKKFSALSRLKSFRYAFDGLMTLFTEEHNAIIHLAILIIVIIAGLFLGITKYDWIVIAIVSSLVFASELFNSAVENLSDIVVPHNDKRIKKIKDMAAAGVLVSAAGAAIAGVLIFLPEIIYHLK